MQFNQGEQVLFKAINAQIYPARILYRKIDFKNLSIDTPNAKGNFDYLVEYELESGFRNISFCMEDDLTSIMN